MEYPEQVLMFFLMYTAFAAKLFEAQLPTGGTLEECWVSCLFYGVLCPVLYFALGFRVLPRDPAGFAL